MIAWSIELSEFGIIYHSRGAIKSQFLTDLVTKWSDIQLEKESSTRVLFVDGSSNLKGSGAGIILKGSEGIAIKQSLRVSFKVTNN